MIATEINILPWYIALARSIIRSGTPTGNTYCVAPPAGMLIPSSPAGKYRRRISSMAVVRCQPGQVRISRCCSTSGLEVVEYAADGYD